MPAPAFPHPTSLTATTSLAQARPDDRHGSSGVSAISISSSSSFGNPSWAVQKLFMAHQPAGLLRSSLSVSGASCTAWANGGSCVGDATPSTMLAASVSSSASGEAQVKLVNYGPQAVALRVTGKGDGHSGVGLATLSWISGAEGDVNSFEYPRRVGVRRRSVSSAASLELPPWSVSVLKAPLSRRAGAFAAV